MLGDMIVARSTKAAQMVRESQARLDAESQARLDAVKELRRVLKLTLIDVPLRAAKIDPAEATRKQQDTIGHGRLYDRAERQVRAIANDVKAKAHVINCLKHAWEDKECFVQAVACFVTPEEAGKLGYHW